MITNVVQVKVKRGWPTIPCATHELPNGKKEYCFGLNIWRASITKAYAAFKEASADPETVDHAIPCRCPKCGCRFTVHIPKRENDDYYCPSCGTQPVMVRAR